jgi:hypothetical protein
MAKQLSQEAEKSATAQPAERLAPHSRSTPPAQRIPFARS